MAEVGKVGVAIDSIEGMMRLFDGINLEQIFTSMTINATVGEISDAMRQVYGEYQETAVI